MIQQIYNPSNSGYTYKLSQLQVMGYTDNNGTVIKPFNLRIFGYNGTRTGSYYSAYLTINSTTSYSLLTDSLTDINLEVGNTVKIQVNEYGVLRILYSVIPL